MSRILLGALLAVMAGITLSYAGGPCATAIGCVSAPEIDPGSAMAALTLLFGGFAALRARKSQK